MSRRDGRAISRVVRAALTTLVVTAAAIGGVEELTSQPSAALTLLTITVAPTTASIAAGNTQQFTATGHYLGGSTQDITNSVTWSSSLTGTATVSSSGLATGVGTGATTITATSGLIFGTAALTVTPGVPPPPATALTTNPGSGPKRTPITLHGANFQPNQMVTVTYLAKSKY